MRKNSRFFIAAVLLFVLLYGFFPAEGDLQSPPVSSSAIVVDFGKFQRAIPPLLFGQNLQSIERGESILEPDGSPNIELLSLLSEAKITTLRFPGGTPADYFHWWQALGPHSRRPLQSTGYLNQFYQPIVGPDEFIKIAVSLRAVPLVTANTGTGSAEEVTAWTKFFKARGFPVTFWEIGNEVYFEGLSENGLVGLPPEVYAKKVIQYAAAVRAEIPEAKIYAAAVIGPEAQDSFWNSVVLGLTGPYVDGISVHNAYFPLYGFMSDRSVPSDEYLFTAMLGATQAVEASMTVLEEQLKRLGKLIPIMVTEYDGIFFRCGSASCDPLEPPEATYKRNPTLASALYNASVLHILMRHDRVFGAYKMSLAGSRFGSLIGLDRGKYYRNPQFFIHREYAKEAGNLLMKLTVEPKNSLFSSGPIKFLSGQTNVPMLDAVATRDPGAQHFALFVVNRSLKNEVVTSVSLTLPKGVKGTISTLTGPAYNAVNDADTPDRVTLVTKPFTAKASFSYRFPPYSLTIFRWSR